MRNVNELDEMREFDLVTPFPSIEVPYEGKKKVIFHDNCFPADSRCSRWWGK